MNRAQRRREGWNKLTPRLPYHEFVEEAGEEAAKVAIALLKSISGGSECPFTDEELWDATRVLVTRGFLNVYIRWSDDGVEIKPEFLTPDPRRLSKFGRSGLMQ